MTDQQAQRMGWPRLRVSDWAETRDTLHMWTQIVGKVRLAHAPLVNHWWEVTVYVTPRGLTTSTIPYLDKALDIEFDFTDHLLRIRTSDGAVRQLALVAQPVARFYTEVMDTLHELGIQTRMWPSPNEVPTAIPFPEDYQHASYDPDAAHLFWQQLLQANRVMAQFRSEFAGKVSPVHLFWGAMDLACTRFSGRKAPPHPGGVPNFPHWAAIEAYSHEVSSCGFWPGGEEGMFYAYAYPEPAGFADRPVSPSEAFYDRDLQEFVLPYEVVAGAPNPDDVLTEFLETTYAAAAELGGWDRAALEVDPHRLDEQRLAGTRP
ncbi:DUF5996 family protein [Amycolatopsis taiwanensis]|uniref:DUF5996 family protein n=1 Tax=Amycolatopsis taiwanensis TaxID=342230 RepID=UPI0004838F5A|nr:DUF5996 family protein [Amycolatopsis taiwanensis]